MGDSKQTDSTQQSGTTSGTTNAMQTGMTNASQIGSTGSTQNALNTTQRDPWAPASSYLTGLLGQASSLYGSTVNPATSGALTSGQNAAIANASGGATTALANQGMGTVSGLLGSDGLSDAQRSALAGIGSSLGSFNSSLGSTTSMLTPIADGSQVGTNNAAFQTALQASLDKARDTIGSQFSGAGRYGSAAMGNAEATTLGNIAASATQSQYNQDRANQLAAIGQLGSLASSGLSGNLSGQSATAGIGQQGIASQLAGIGTIGSLGSAQNQDASTLMSVGNQGWSNLDNYASILQALGQQGGTSTGSSAGSTSGTSAQNSSGTTSGTSSGSSSGVTNSSGTSTRQNQNSLLGDLLAGVGLFTNGASGGLLGGIGSAFSGLRGALNGGV